MKLNLLKSPSESSWVISLWPNKQISVPATQRCAPRELKSMKSLLAWKRLNIREKEREKTEWPNPKVKCFLLLFRINMDPASFLVSFSLLQSTHMFLFKASSADYHDWCVHPPPSPDSLSNGWLPTAVEGRPFLSTALLIFHRETSPFFHSFAPQSSPPTVSSFSVSPSSPLFLFLWILRFNSGHESSVGIRCIPCKHFTPVPCI